jgi:glutamyl-tRNA synthetase
MARPMETAPVTRFAPSPTGHLHVGGARTALYNWALGQSGGRYLLRVEDTDQTRSSARAVSGILDDLHWLGLDWTEGPVWEGQGGDPHGIGPFFQAQRVAGYQAAAETLIERDLAYPAFETPEELDALRAVAQAEKRAFRYRCPAGFDREAALVRRAAGEPYVVRFRMPRHAVTIRDAVLGEVSFEADQLDDFVILKRDGFPTYHLSVVVDDEAMGVTHVLRGQEHLNNTPRHVALQQALGFREPVYAHLAIIFNADGSKMSKRDKDKVARAAWKALAQAEPERARALADPIGADVIARWAKDKKSQLDAALLVPLAEALGLELPCIEVEDFRRAGLLPEVLCNYLALLGWSPGEKDAEGKDLERFDRTYLREHFDLARLGRGNAKFDADKLLAFNQDTLAAMSDADFLAAWSEWCERYAPAVLERDVAWRERYAAAIRTRCRTLADAATLAGPGGFVWLADDAIVFDEKAVAKHLAKGEPSGLSRLGEVREVLAGLDRFEPEPIEAAVKAFCVARDIGMGKLAQPLRVAATGSSASPPLGDTLALLGKESVLARIDRCLATHGGI